MARGKQFSAEQIVATPRQIEVQIAQAKRLALACAALWPTSRWRSRAPKDVAFGKLVSPERRQRAVAGIRDGSMMKVKHDTV